MYLQGSSISLAINQAGSELKLNFFVQKRAKPDDCQDCGMVNLFIAVLNDTNIKRPFSTNNISGGVFV